MEEENSDFERLLVALSREASLESITYVQFAGGESTGLHVHRDLLHLTVTEAGKGLCVVGQTCYPLRPGTITFVYPNEVHSFWVDEKDPYRNFTLKISIEGILPKGLPRQMNAGKDWKKLCKLLHKLHSVNAWRKDAAAMLLEASVLLEIFAIILKVGRGKAVAESPTSVSREFEKTLFMLQEPPFTFPGLDRLSKINQMNRRCFTDYFRKITGVSPAEFQACARMNHAKRILEKKTCSVKEAAMRCGYTNSQNFIRAYKKHFSMTPAKSVVLK